MVTTNTPKHAKEIGIAEKMGSCGSKAPITTLVQNVFG